MKPYYEHGGITIYQGDCLDLIPSLVFDIIVTDPPYGISWTRSAVNGCRDVHDGIVNDHDTSFRDAALALAPNKPAVLFGSFYAPFPRDLRQVLVWSKPGDAGVVGSVTGYRRDAEPVFLVGPWPVRKVARSSVLRSAAECIGIITKQTGHPHTKPLDLMKQLISAAPDGVILDPFAGSGTTLRAAKDLGRKAIGIEIEERYCEIAARRLGQEVLPLRTHTSTNV